MKWFFDLPLEYKIGIVLGIVLGIVTLAVIFG